MVRSRLGFWSIHAITGRKDDVKQIGHLTDTRIGSHFYPIDDLVR